MYTRKQGTTRKRCPRVAPNEKEGTGVNTRGGQVLTRYQHSWSQFKVRHLLLGQADRFVYFVAPMQQRDRRSLPPANFEQRR